MSLLDSHGTFPMVRKGKGMSQFIDKGGVDPIRNGGLHSAVPNPDFTGLSDLECRGKVAGRRLLAGPSCPGGL